MIKIEFDGRKLEQLVKGLRSLPKGFEQAATRSINRTLTTTRKELSTRIRSDYNVKAGAIKNDLHITKADYSTLSGNIKSEGSPGVPLINYQSRSRITPSGSPSTRWKGNHGKKTPFPQPGVSLVVRTGKRKKIKGSFVNKMATGHLGVFRRVTPAHKMKSSNKPAIRELYGPSAARILTGGRYQEDIEDIITETMAKNMDRELKNLLRKLGR